MIDRRTRRAVAAGLTLLALLTAACGRDDGETEVGADTTAAPSGTDGGGDTTSPSGGGLDSGGFGDIETVCQDGDASGATDVGVTDDSIQVGVFTDKGFSARPGLNEEMYDAAVAFAEWCNAHGGILGRELVVADRDAALTDFNARIIDSCAQDFAMVGGGAVLDDADNGGRIACGLPNIAGYVVSTTARQAELQVQPVPNAVGKLAIGAHQRIAEEFPDLIDSYGVITSSFGSVLTVRDETVAALESEGWSVVYSEEYNSAGESNWRPFVEAMRDSGVEIFELVGEPTFFAQILEAMEAVGWRPQVMIQQTNFYDRTFVETAGDIAQNVYVRTQYTPLELADQNQATADYIELLEATGGKIAQLGMQSMSAFLLFAQSATACGSELTRACLLEQASSVDEWTGGGLHAPQDLATNTPSPCFLLLDVTPEGFVYNEQLTKPTDGLFNCEPDNVFIAGG
jgi:hypothetical protein